jgi:hypothetical protein
MMLSRNQPIVLLVPFLLGGCVPSEQVRATDGNDESSYFCKIAENLKDHVGADVELRARYVSDGKHEEVLEDQTCKEGRRIIDIGERGNSVSVANFYAERKKICSERGASYLCSTSAEVDVLGRITTMSGEFVLDINEVREFNFEQNSPK